MIKRKGFTVIELVIAITVIIILLGIGTVGFRSSKVRYRDREREADVQAIAAYLEKIYPKEIKINTICMRIGQNLLLQVRH